MNPMRKATVITALSVLLSVTALAGVAQAQPETVVAAKSKSFLVTGGTVTLTLDAAFTTALANAGASFSTGGKATTEVNKDTGQTEVTFPVKRKSDNVLSLYPSCRCLKVALDGTIYITGNNVTRTGTNPVLQIDGTSPGGISATFGLGGYGDAGLGSVNPYPLPKSYGGKSLSLDLGTLTDSGNTILYKGMVRYAGEPGDGPMPTYNGGPVGQVTADLKLRAQR